MSLIALDNKTDGGISTGVTSKTYAHTVSGFNRDLRVTILSTGGDLITGVTYNGVAMTQIVKKAGDSTRYVYIYELVAPATGTNNIFISASGSTNITSHAVSYNNCAQLGQPDATNTDQHNSFASGAANGVTVTSILDNCWITGASIKTGGGAATASTNTTSRFNTNSLFTGDTNAAQTPAGGHSINAFGSDGSQNWYWVGASLAPAIPIVKTIQIGGSVNQKAKYISIGGRVKKNVIQTIQLGGRCYNPYTPGRLSNLEVRSIDIQKFTKDTLQSQASNTLFVNLCNFLAANFNLTHIAPVALIDPPTIYPSGFVVSPLTAAQYNQEVCDAIHATGLNVLHRLTSMAMEGSPNFPAWPPVNDLLPGSYSSVVPTTITDTFNRTSIGSNYVNNASSGGFWEISAGRLTILNAGNEFSYNISHRVESFTDGTFQITVEKGSFGHDAMIFCGAQKSTTPFYQGYAIHMSGNNLLSLEDIGARDITNDTRSILATSSATNFITGNNYNIKVVKNGTHIQVKVWDVNNSEPSGYQIDVTNSLYSTGWVGFSTDGFSKVIHFDNLSITPAQNLNNYIGMVYNWIINNPTTFRDNDIVAPFPEFDTCQDFNSHCYFNPNASWLHAQYGQNTVNFFNDLKDVEDLAASQIGIKLKTGFTTYNFTSLQSVTDPGKVIPNFNDLDYKDSDGLTMMAKTGALVVDWYGTTTTSEFNPTGGYHLPQEMYDSMLAVYNKYHLPVFLQEWGGFVGIDLTNVSAHDSYYRTMFNKFADLADLGAFTRFSYWGAQDTGDADTGLLRNGGTNWSAPTLRVKGQVLQQFYQTGLPTTRTIKIGGRVRITPTVKTIQIGGRNAGVNPVGRLGSLITKSLDLMKWTKDTILSQPSDLTISNLVRFADSNFNLTHLALCFPIDPPSFFTAGWNPYPRSIVGVYQQWTNEIHSRGLNVLHRPVSFSMEGSGTNFIWRVGANRIPTGTPSSAPTDHDTTWLGIMYDFIVNNPNLFHDGDKWAPFPERTQGLFDQPDGIHSFVADPIQSNYVQFFIDVKTVSNTAFALINKNVGTGYTGDNYSEVRSGYISQSLYNAEGHVAFDYYQNYNGNGFGAVTLAEDLDAVYYAKGNLPLFYEEWGSVPDMIIKINAAREGTILYNNQIIPIADVPLTAHPENRLQLFYDFFNTLSDQKAAGKLIGFNYWGLWDTGENDTGLIKINGSSEVYENLIMRPEAYIVQAYFADGSTPPPSLSSKQAITPLPTIKEDLEFVYTPSEVLDVETDDGIGAQIAGVKPTYLIQQYKIKHSNNTDAINIKIDVQSNIPPTTSPIYLQIYNVRTREWENIASDNTFSTGVDFQLQAIVTQNTTDYYDKLNYPYFNIEYNANEVTFRVYQSN